MHGSRERVEGKGRWNIASGYSDLSEKQQHYSTREADQKSSSSREGSMTSSD